MNNLSSYCGLVDAKIRASVKDLPVLYLMYLVTCASSSGFLDCLQTMTTLCQISFGLKRLMRRACLVRRASLRTLGNRRCQLGDPVFQILLNFVNLICQSPLGWYFGMLYWDENLFPDFCALNRPWGQILGISRSVASLQTIFNLYSLQLMNLNYPEITLSSQNMVPK